MKFRGFKRWRWKTFVVALCVVLFFLVLPTRFTSPYRLLFRGSLQSVRDAAFSGGGALAVAPRGLVEGEHAADRERAMRVELRTLQNRVRRLEDQLRLSEERRLSLERIVKVLPHASPLSARVIGYDTDELRGAIHIDSGRSQGVRRSAGVCFAGALVGIVKEAGGREAQVLLLTDPACRVAARVQRSRVPCIARGNGSPELDLLWVKRDADVRVGDLVVTNNFTGDTAIKGAGLPAGIPIGLVMSVGPSRLSPMVMAVKVRPVLDLTRLELVDVLR